jgi:DNA-binding CsgD family transcriptional regulator
MPASVAEISRQDSIPSSIVPLEIGAAALTGHLRLAEPAGPVPTLTPRETLLVTWVSLGASPEKMAYMLGAHPNIVNNRMENIKGKIGIYDEAALTHYAIQKHLIPVKVKRDPEIVTGLEAFDRFALNCFAAGISDRVMSRRLKHPESAISDRNDLTLQELGARTKAQAVRIGHRIGFLGVRANSSTSPH